MKTNRDFESVQAAYLAIKKVVLNTKGVFKLSRSITDEISFSLLRRDNPNRGLKLTENKGVYNLDVSVIVNFGAGIPELAWELQRNIADRVKSIKGAPLKKINIHVQGVNVISAKKGIKNE